MNVRDKVLVNNELGEITNIIMVNDNKLYMIKFDDPIIEKSNKINGLLFKENDIKIISLIHYSKYLNGKQNKIFICDEINIENMSHVFKQIECHNIHVKQLIANENTIELIHNKFPQCITKGTYFWSAKIIKNDLLLNSEIFLTSDII